MLLVLLTFSAIFGTTFSANIQGKIINGEKASIGQIPWIVAINYEQDGNPRFCGGTLISEEWVLTAGHCVEGSSKYSVMLGGIEINNPDDESVFRGVDQAILHPDYILSTLTNDIALLKLDQPVEFSDRITTIPLNDQEVPEAGTNVRSAGWGYLNDDMTQVTNFLHYVDLVTITQDECLNFFNADLVHEYTICTDGSENKGNCHGDSGGPLWVTDDEGNPTLVGVYSFLSSKGCTVKYPSGFSDVTAFLGFIRDNTGLDV